MTGIGSDAELDLGDLESVSTLAVLTAPPDGRVLVVGTDAPAVAHALADRGSRVWTVIEDAASSEAARAVSEQVFTGSLAQLNLVDALGTASLDVVVLLDVVDRLIDPVAYLEETKCLLDSGGRIVASLYNATHAAARLQLLRGRLPLSARTSLHRPPPRLFDRTTAEELFARAGLHAVEILSVRRELAELELEVDPLSFSAEAISEASSGPDAAAYQFVVVAEPRTDNAAADGRPSVVEVHRDRIAELEKALYEAGSDVEALALRLEAAQARASELESLAGRAAELDAVLSERMVELEEANHGLKHLRHDLLVKERFIAELKEQLLKRTRRGKEPRLPGQDPSLRERVVARADRSLMGYPAVHRLIRSAYRAVKRLRPQAARIR